ncbi:MAG: chitobiase/beta-hexosaminidase C-terminal domain-containing protein [Pseudomonadota bacterium]
MPALLSQTGAFTDVRKLAPAPGLFPYELLISFWSDGADKSRYVAIPQAKVAFSKEGEWGFPPGTVFVKTFELPAKRLETRLLVLDRNGGVYGVTYKWRADLSDADLLAPAGLTEEVAVRNADDTHSQTWYYPSREDCLVCHNSHTKGVLGPKTRQLNRELRYPDGVVENQLRRWIRLGLFSPDVQEKDIPSFAALARPNDTNRSIEERARSWLDVNCAHCHRPGGTVANFDARYETPLVAQRLIDGPVLIDQGVDRARVISPHDPWRSMALLRIDTNDDIRMPPLARHVIDATGVAVIRQWILSLPGRDVLPPPTMQPGGGNFNGPVTVSLASSEPGADIRYTLDGSAPGPSDAHYEGPIRVEGPAVLRARVYKEGLTRSVIAQQTYVIDR